MAELKLLETRRKSIKAAFTRIKTYVTNFHANTGSMPDLSIRNDRLEELYSEFNEIQNQICAITDNYGDEEFEEMETNYYMIKSKIKDILNPTGNKSGSSLSDSCSSADQNHHQTINLPKLNLPTFDGKIENWVSFYDLFESTINANPSLSDIQKYYYLKSSLKGEPQDLLASLPLTQANYTVALELLKDRFSNKRLIVNTHLKALFSLPNANSAPALKTILDTANVNIRALTNLGYKTNEWDVLLVYLITSKFDQDLRTKWELNNNTKEVPTFEQLQQFLNHYIQAVEACGDQKLRPSNSNAPKHYSIKSNNTELCTHSSYCPVCNQSHELFRCKKFLSLKPYERVQKVKQLRRCLNCFSANHMVRSCTASKCKVCSKAHNTLLHINKTDQGPINNSHDTENKAPDQVASEESTVQSSNVETKVSPKVLSLSLPSKVLLSTALIKVQDSRGEYQSCRALIDPGSEGSFISESTCQRLGLKRQPLCVSVQGIGSTNAGNTRGFTNFQIKTKFESIHVKAYILSKLTNVASLKVSTDHWAHIENLNLADPHFYRSSQIDIILGADIFASLLLEGIVRGPPGTPSAINSKLGYLLSGEISTQPSKSIQSMRVSIQENISSMIEKFWEIEDVCHDLPIQASQGNICEDHFKSTHSRSESGRFCVRLPFKPSITELGDSYPTALRRFRRLESTLVGENRKSYNAFMKEYIDLNHMHPTPKEKLNVKSSVEYYYLPHHAVYRESSTTTKIRVVFDASAKSSSGSSLNDHLHVGPKLQVDIVELLTRFRLHKYVFTADIEKFYRQILVAEPDQAYQRVLWRNSPNDPIVSYDLSTVTYGTSPAPYLAIRCLHQLSDEVENSLLEVSRVLKKDFYVDDLLTGANTIEQALALKRSLNDTLSQAGFILRKWSSNSREILNDSSLDQTSFEFQSKDSLVKVLGLLWEPTKDVYQYVINRPQPPRTVTKRYILSQIARLFDPLGLLCPVITKAKLIMQKTWLSTKEWDVQLPQDITNEFLHYCKELSTLTDLTIPRPMTLFDVGVTHQLFGFCDASENAYAAVIYLRSVTVSQDVTTSLICSKSKICPLKRLTIPRLELCGAVLLAKLMNKIMHIVPADKLFLFSDSTIVLAWISKYPSYWKAFVSSRITQIQELTKKDDWYHVKSEDNPADIASRGVIGQKFLSQDKWWLGPKWLSNPTLSFKSEPFSEEDIIPEQRQIKSFHTSQVVQDNIDEWYLKYSSYTNAVRVTAYCYRYIRRLRNKKVTSGPLSSDELSEALSCIIRQVQKLNFSDELFRLLQNKNVKQSSKISSLYPILDDKGILRVGGRIHNSNQDYNKLHQIILPVRHQFVFSMIVNMHKMYLHAGPQYIINALRQKYWLVGNVRSAVRHVVRNCTRCLRFSKENIHPLMGTLPTSRVTFQKCFYHTGCDYAGPFLTKQVGRSKVMRKSYLAVFVCMGVKAIHLELVSELTTDCFLAAFNRFISRRGLPSHMYSDNGSNFIGADNTLKKFLQQEQDSMLNFSAEKSFKWHFNPPSAPHMGGIWESAVKSAKHHLKRVMGNTVLTFEELNTLIIQIEAILNSRPLCQLSSDQSEVNILTPAHFLIGEAIHSISEDNMNGPINNVKRWTLVQRLRKQFWDRWQKEYLHTLQQRHKWKFESAKVKIGDVVLIREDNLPPLKYLMGIVIELFPGRDEITRVVTIKTQNGLLKRPVVKLIKIPLESSF